MSKTEYETRIAADEAFDDPVAYLARFGIEAEVVTETSLREAA